MNESSPINGDCIDQPLRRFPMFRESQGPRGMIPWRPQESGKWIPSFSGQDMPVLDVIRAKGGDKRDYHCAARFGIESLDPVVAPNPIRLLPISHTIS